MRIYGFDCETTSFVNIRQEISKCCFEFILKCFVLEILHLGLLFLNLSYFPFIYEAMLLHKFAAKSEN